MACYIENKYNTEGNSKMKKVNSRLVGFVSGGKWSKEERKFVVGKFKAGDKFGLSLALSVSKKKGEGREYGLPVPITVFAETMEEGKKVLELIDGGMVVLEGYFSPNNYEKEGKTIRGNQFNCSAKDICSVDDYDGGTVDEPTEAPVEEDENPWND
jgi:hypothetical protein